jgi:hypothetical protein
MNYNTELVCTYKILEDEDPDDIMYRSQFLQVFNLKKWNSAVVDSSIHALYEKIKDSEQFKKIIKLTPNRFVPGDDELSFHLLFSYETFYILHKCLQDFFKNDKIEDNNYNLFIEKLKGT